jgi:hypothetical protein
MHILMIALPELLTRLRLYGLAAHLRKYAGLDDIRILTRVRDVVFLLEDSERKYCFIQLETTIYTLCARCRKPFSPPVDTPRPGHHVKGGYSYCRTCRIYPAKCSIWYVTFSYLYNDASSRDEQSSSRSNDAVSVSNLSTRRSPRMLRPLLHGASNGRLVFVSVTDCTGPTES